MTQWVMVPVPPTLPLKECSEPSTAIKMFLYTFPTPNKINVQTHLDLVGYRWLVFQLVFY